MNTRATHATRVRRLVRRTARQDGRGTLDAFAALLALLTLAFAFAHTTVTLNGLTHSSIPIVRDAAVQASSLRSEVSTQYTAVVNDSMIVSLRSSVGSRLRGKADGWEANSQPAQHSLLNSLLSLLHSV